MRGLGQFVNAKGMFEKAVRMTRATQSNFEDLGLVYDKLGSANDAIRAWEKALKLKPDDEAVLQELAFVYNRLNRNKDAIRIYPKLAQIEPDSAKYHNDLGIAYYKQRQVQRGPERVRQGARHRQELSRRRDEDTKGCREMPWERPRLKPSARRFSEYLSGVFGAAPGSVRLTPLGRGSHGRGYRARFIRDGVGRNVIIKTLDKNIGLGHDYPADRASVFLLASESYGKFPSHVKALDVLSLQGDGALKSIAGGHEYYLIMEEGEGTNYFQDLRDMKGMPKLTRRDGEQGIRAGEISGEGEF